MKRPCIQGIIIDSRGHRARIPAHGVFSGGLSLVDQCGDCSAEEVVYPEDDATIDRNPVTDFRRRVERVWIILKECEALRQGEGWDRLHFEREVRREIGRAHV